MRKNILVALSITFLLAALLIPLLNHVYLNYFRHEENWKQRTTPLSYETINILCRSFNLDSNDPLCSWVQDVYGPDFYLTIRDTFRPYEAYGIPSSESANYDEVEEKIGMFKYECSDVITTGNGFSYFRCEYDLRGDREFIIGIIYSYPDNAVFRINTPMGLARE